MGTFTWLGGDIGNGNNWSSGGSTGTEPGPNDDAVLANGGHVLGLASVGQAEFTGAFVLSGANLQAGGEALSSGGSITQKDGINAIVSAARSLGLLGATYTLSGGTLSGPQATEFVSGTFKQFSGTNTIGEIEMARSPSSAAGCKAASNSSASATAAASSRAAARTRSRKRWKSALAAAVATRSKAAC
jgi:hypothetical protein